MKAEELQNCEEWNDIPTYEGVYKINKKGDVFSVRRNRKLKPSMRYLYYSVVLAVNKINKKMSIHRLVAIVFIPNPENKPCVNHKDGNKINNNWDNLEWATYSENELHSHHIMGKKISHSKETRLKMQRKAKNREMPRETILKSANTRRGKPLSDEVKHKLSMALKKKNSFPIIQYDLNMNIIRIWDGGATEAARELSLSQPGISMAVNGKSKKSGGFVWRRVN